MSDQTPPTDAPQSGEYPSPPTPPIAPPAPPYPSPQQSQYPGTQQYPGNPQYPAAPQHPGAPAANPAYPPAGYYPGTYPPAYPAAGPTPPAEPTPKRPGGLGLMALMLALAAAVVAPLVGAVAAFQVGSGTWTWSSMETMPGSAWQDLSFLAPVREWVLLGEIAFWAGTVLGIWAIVQGIIAIAKRRGLGTGIAAIVVAVVALFVFGSVVYGAGIAGIVSGASAAGTGV